MTRLLNEDEDMTNVVPSVTKIRIPCDQTRYGGKIGKLKNMKGSPCYMVKRLDHSHILIDGDIKRKACSAARTVHSTEKWTSFEILIFFTNAIDREFILIRYSNTAEVPQ
ncbi:hypothetical protein MAR_027098, partial [Mya arenaria]